MRLAHPVTRKKKGRGILMPNRREKVGGKTGTGGRALTCPTLRLEEGEEKFRQGKKEGGKILGKK